MSDHPGFASRLFLSGSLAFVAIGVLGASYGISLPALGRIYGLDDGQAGLILSAHPAGAVTAVLAGTLGLRGLTARVAAALMLAGGALIAAGLNWPATLFGAYIAGMGFGITATHVNRAFLQGFGPRGPAMVGLVNGISAVGLIAAPLIFVALDQSVPLLFGGIVALSVLTFLLQTPRDDSFAGSPRGLPDLRGRKLGLVSLNLFSAMMESALGGFGLLALMATGWSEDGGAMLVSGFYLAFLVARLSLYWLSRLIAPDVIFLLATLGTAGSAGLAVMGFEAAGYVLSGGFVGIAFPAFYVWGSRLLGPDPRMGSSMLLSGLLGLVAGALVIGPILSAIGLDLLFELVALVGLALAAAVMWMRASPRPPLPVPDRC